MRILYSGPLNRWNTTEARRKALVELGHDIEGLDSIPYFERGPVALRKLHWHFLLGPGVASYNAALRKRAAASKFDLIWIDQGVGVWPQTVQALRTRAGSAVVHYTSDDVERWRRTFRHFHRAIPYYDVQITTNPLNIPFLKGAGARKVVRAEFGYDPAWQRPPRLDGPGDDQFRRELVFVGHWEPATEAVAHAVRCAGLPLEVWGTSWKKARDRTFRPNGTHFGPLMSDPYVKTLAGARIALGVVSKWNRNQSAGRTFEIPAVGGFLLGERTDDHLSYYEEGREAEFFASAEELVDKARYYLQREPARAAIARAGHERCLKSGYTHRDRVEQVLRKL